MPLRITEYEHPSGATYGVFFLGRDEIGRAKKIGDCWILFRTRKVLNEEQAAKAMIDRMLRKARDDEARARKLLDGLRMYCGGRLPPDGSKPHNNQVQRDGMETVEC